MLSHSFRSFLTSTNEGLVYKITVDSLTVTSAGFNTSRTAVGTWRFGLGNTLITALMTGDVYVSLNTAEFPKGAIRGQILPNGGTGFIAVFDSNAAGGQNQTTASRKGAAFFVLTDAGLNYDISAAGYTGNSASITMGQNGSAVTQLGQAFNGGSAKGVWLMINDSTAAGNRPALFNQDLYVNLASGTQGITGMSAQIRRTFEAAPVSVRRILSAPESFAVEQNYPNPFYPTTTIRFTISENGLVSLNVYNVIGEKVATLVDG